MADNKQESVPPIPVLEVVAFVDATTVVLTGHRVDELKEGDELYVLGIGFTVVPKVNVPLVAPKASLEVTFAPGPYVLAQSPAEKVQVGGDILLSATRMAEMFGGRTETRRRALTTDEKQFIGNPGKESVKVGDVAIRKRDLTQYIKYIVAHPGETRPILPAS